MRSVRPRPLSTSRIGSALRRRRGNELAAGPASGVSVALRAFVDELPHERAPILVFMQRSAAALPRGSRVLDAGAGDAPYRELFVHCDYVTADWPNSVHAGGRGADVVASLDALPLADMSFDAVVSTQVLEHVARPKAVLAELYRVLRDDGALWLTAPLVWPLHEEPYDFYRYTEHGLRHLLDAAGFVDVDARPRNGCLATLSQLALFCANMLQPMHDGRDQERRRIVEDLWRLGDQLARYDDLDTKRLLPLGYEVTARRPSPAS